MRWLIYALGGGLGHLTRSVALARAAGRRGVPCTLLANSPYAECLPVTRELNADDRLIIIPPDLDRDATAARVRDVLGKTEFGLLVVDTFPRGLGGELADLHPSMSVPKALVHRDLNPRYVESYQLTDFVQFYDGVLLPGEDGPLGGHPAALHTEPWLIRDSDELMSRTDARRQLIGEDLDENPIVLVSGSGRSDEIDQMGQLADWLREHLAGRAHVCFTSPDRAEDRQRESWPVFGLYAGVDVLIGAGGYNTVSEARATQTPLLAFARQRLYDRQQARLNDYELVINLDDLLARLQTMVDRSQPAAEPAAFRNGTHQGVTFLTALCSRI